MRRILPPHPAVERSARTRHAPGTDTCALRRYRRSRAGGGGRSPLWEGGVRTTGSPGTALAAIASADMAGAGRRGSDVSDGFDLDLGPRGKCRDLDRGAGG